jgi:hypothetical protein
MGRKATCAVALLGVIAGLCACTRQETAKTLARRLSDADRVVFTSGKSATVTFTNEQVKRIVEAIEVSEKIPLKRGEEISATVEYHLGFFKGTNCLATVPASYPLFWVGQKPYQDKSESLQAFYDELRLSLY